MEKVIKKNGLILDSSQYKDTHHVYQTNGCAYSSTLNQTYIKYNNNKFYILQILEHDNGNEYLVYTRYGRIGNLGVTNTSLFTSSLSAICFFEKTFKSKTGNNWDARDNFIKKTGKYFMSHIDYGEDCEDEKKDNEQEIEEVKNKNDEEVEKKEIESQLDKRIQEFIQLISNISIINCTMKEFNIDLRKMPLGKISKKQIQEGYEILKKIAKCLEDNNFTDLEDLTSNFYTLIPSSFGRQKPPIINSEEQIKKYTDMLGILIDLEVAGSILSKKNSNSDHNCHPIDRIYRDIKIDLTPLLLDNNGEEYIMIKKYIENTIGSTHNHYQLELLDILKVYRKEEGERFIDYGNKRLLFHGSRVANFVGILSQGLRVNSNAVKTGSMFGPGLYFSDCVTKSANYCFTDRKNNVGIILLCEVSLGNMYEKTSCEFVTWLPNDKFQSTWGMGGSGPNQDDFHKLENDVIVPYGKLNKNNSYYGLLYNEYIVYQREQVKIKYAVKLRFGF